ncbi:MAG: diguanylate cyclase [Rubellimicrobium sp.]|nr:diguanylate cyclase [Rubellimicrobium sp.]
MAGHILIVESTSSRRIQLRGLLAAAHYGTVLCPDPQAAAGSLAEDLPDLVLLDIGTDRQAAFTFLAAIRARADSAALPVIAFVGPSDSGLRLAALKAGADDVLQGCAEPGLLLARIRSLLRERDATPALHLARGAARALGMADAMPAFVPAGRTVIVTPRPDTLPPILATLARRLPGGAVFLDPEANPGTGDISADLFVIDHAGQCADGPDAARLFRLIADLQSRPATRHARLMVIVPEGAAALARMALDLGADDLVPDTVDHDELTFRIRTLLRRKSLADSRRDRVESGLAAALTDPLTGLANRRHAVAELEVLAERLADGGPAWSAILLDIDHFKRVNDTHGHATGDRVLRELAALLRANVRIGDLVARIGGEEFLVMLPDTPRIPACIVAERLRHLVEEARIPTDAGDGLQVTLSAGVATAEACMAGDGIVPRLLGRADRALYAAKSAGRNRITVADGDDGPDRPPWRPEPRLPVLLPCL